MKKNKHIQLSLFDHLEDLYRKDVLYDIDLIMGRNIDVFKTVPRSIERLKYIRDVLKAYKKGGVAQVESEGLKVGDPKFNLSEKCETILSELISKSRAQPGRGTPRARPTNPDKT